MTSLLLDAPPLLRALVAAALGSLAISGCGGNVSIGDGGGGSGGDAGGSTGGSGGTTVTTTSVTTGTGGGIGGGPACDVPPPGHFSMEVWTPDNHVWGCADQDTQTGTLSFDAAVVKSGGNALSVDACSPAADCLPQIFNLTFDAEGLYVDVPVGAFVHVEVAVDVPWGCSHRLSITALPNWAGEPSPVPAGHTLYLAAADGTVAPPAGAPFIVTPIKLDCPGYPSGCGGGVEPGQYALRFSSIDDPSAGVLVETGELKNISLVETWAAVKNLRSFESGACDDYWNWAYWVVPGAIK